MDASAEKIYQSLLFRAADEWDIDYVNVNDDLGNQFDPLVRFMAGGLATELEKVYQSLDATEQRLQRRLTRVLLPEYYHLPDPAHCLATASPNADPVLIDETVQFTQALPPEEEDQTPTDFTPVFSSRLLPVKLAVVATDSAIVTNKPSRGLRRKNTNKKIEVTKRLLLGFKAPLSIENWEGSSLWFGLTGANQKGEQDDFLRAINGALAYFGEQELIPQVGLGGIEPTLEEHLNGNERLRKRIKAYYDRHFLTFREQQVPETRSINAFEFLTEWFSKALEEEELKQELKKVKSIQKDALYWLEIHLGSPMETVNLSKRLQVRFNTFPVVSRTLNGAKKGKGEHHFLQSSRIKWLHLQPKDHFISIRKVYLEANPDTGEFTFKPFADFKEDKKPSYTVRHGGIGRWDDFNAWQRLAYVITILQDNYQQDELIKEAAKSLSLEDVHHLLGKEISASDRNASPTKDVYILLHAGLKSGVRVRVEYWTSTGEAANGIPAGTVLKCVHKKASRLDKGTLQLITTSSRGRAPLGPTEELNAIKYSVLSRGRIVTREDVKTYCLDSLGDDIKNVQVKDGVGIDPNFNFGMTRTLDVFLEPTLAAKDRNWAGTCHQLQVLLEEKTTTHIPVRVFLKGDNA